MREGSLHRQRLQEDGVDDAENRGIRADAEPRVSTAITVNAGDFTSIRPPKRKSCQRAAMRLPSPKVTGGIGISKFQ